MQFQIPQFLDIEDKVFGPLTVKQFIYVLGGGGIAFVLYKLLPIFISLPLAAASMGLAVALAFVKINNRPFIIILEAFLKHAIQPKFFIWKKRTKPVEQFTRKEEVPAEEKYGQKLSASRLKDISWSLDVLDISKKDKT